MSANNGANTVSVLFGNGVGGFAAKVDFATGSGPNAVAIADVNGDGRPDLVTANYNGGDASVLLGDGSGGFGTKTQYATGSNPISVAVSDVNADGRPDAVVANYSGSSVSVLLGLVPTRTVLTVISNPSLLRSALTLRASVTAPAPGYGSPNDTTVSFFDGTTLIGSSRVNAGLASLSLQTPYLGDHPLTAVYKGDSRLFPSISAPQTLHSVDKPKIASITDVKGDQGRQVRLRFKACPLDYPGSGTVIVRYEMFRQVVPGSSPAFSLEARGAKDARPTGIRSVQVDGWDFVATFSAQMDSFYTIVIPTLADSNATGLHRVTLFVRAETSTPGNYFDSAPDSGYSVDNLPPAVPAPFVAAYVSGATALHWGRNTEPDLWYYRLYRGTFAGFVPSASNLIATRSDTGYVDPGTAGSFYKLSAIDVNGNESGFAVLTPGGTADVQDASLSFALARLAPNPSRGDRLVVRFTLPVAQPARLELLDIGGRLVSRRDVGPLGVGRHAVDLATGQRLAPGIYHVRLTQGSRVQSARAVVLD